MTEAFVEPSVQEFPMYDQSPTSPTTQDGYTGTPLYDFISASHLAKGVVPVPRLGNSPLGYRSTAELIVNGLLESVLTGTPNSGGSDTLSNVLVDHLKQLEAVSDGSAIVPAISFPFTPKFTPLTMLESFNSRTGGDKIQYDPDVIRSFSLDAYNRRIDEKRQDKKRAVGAFVLLGVATEPAHWYRDMQWGGANLSDYLQAQWLLRQLSLPQIQGMVAVTSGFSADSNHLVAESNEWAIRLRSSYSNDNRLPVLSL